MMPRLPLTHPLHLVFGLTIWSIWFVAIYGGLSVACARVPPGRQEDASFTINVVLALLTLATVALLVWLAWRGLRAGKATDGRERYLARLSTGLYAFSAVGTLYVGLPVIALPPCL